MNVGKKTISLVAIYLLLLSSFAVINLNPPASADANGAVLTGNIFDSGKDTDSDGSFNYLEVAVEISVLTAGYYRLTAGSLVDQYGYSLYLYTSSEGYLDAGLQHLNLSFFGMAIYSGQLNPKAIPEITLYDEYYYYLGSVWDAQLSRIYDFTEFDAGSSLTGNVIFDVTDNDGDELFNSLLVGVEINVTEAADYQVYIGNPYGDVYIYMSNQSTNYLLPGIQTLNVSFYGAKIYASHGNISWIGEIQLSIIEGYNYYLLDSLFDVPMDRTYNFSEFDPMALLTGIVLGEGIDNDANGLFDLLQISMEVNVTDAGEYSVSVERVFDDDSRNVWIWGWIRQSFEVGPHLVNFTAPGLSIYSVRLNPTYVGSVRLSAYSMWEEILLEEHYMLPLSTPYNYYEFESHAFLTGKIYDRGVDTDADALFNYLEVGVEVNVTKAGTYTLSAGGLAEKLDNTTRTVYVYPNPQFVTHLNLGIHMVNLTFPGPMIPYHRINPMNVTQINLAEPSYPLDYISTTALSTTYDYKQFNHPFSGMQIELTVYPNSTVGVGGTVNYTNIYPPSYSYLVNATLDFSTSGDLTTGSLTGAMLLPEYPYQYGSQFPFNSTTAEFLSEYNNGIMSAQLNTTVLVPKFEGTDWMGQPISPVQLNSSNFSFLGIYSDGVLSVDLHGEAKMHPYYSSQFPFNITDATVLADYIDNEIKGNITFHTVSGFPLGDIIVYFNGNKTDISFTGYVNVLYGDYYGMDINATTLEQILTEFNNTIPGRGDNSLYNMTEGMLECTALNTAKTPIDSIGARIDYSATLHGNFTELISTYLSLMLFGSYAPEETFSTVYAAVDAALSSAETASLELNYWHSSQIASIDLTLAADVKAFWGQVLQSVPPSLPSEYITQAETWLKMANATAYALESVNIEAEYSGATQRLHLWASVIANVTKMKDEIIPILPDAVPPELTGLVESCINATYCTLRSLNVSCNYADNVTNFSAEWLLENDFKAELNHLKNCYIEYLELASPYMINWQIHMLNATEADISNLKADIRQGSDWMTLAFEGLKLYPAKDEIDPIRFKLYNWLGMTSEANTPKEFEKLGISIVGGSNATHTILLAGSSGMPAPDMVSLDYKSMNWDNVSASDLRDLLFKIAFQAIVDHLGETYYIPIFTNSTVNNFNFDAAQKSMSFNVTGSTGTGFFNITIPRALLYAAPEEWVVTIDGTPLSLEQFNLTENAEYVFIYLNYSHSSHFVEITGTWVISEFPPNILPVAMLILVLVAAIFAVKQRKTLQKIKTKYQHAIYRIVRLQT